MSDLFGAEDARATARRNPASGPPSSFTESLKSAFNITFETGRSDSANMALYNAYDAYLTEVRDHTGKGFPNPYSHGPLIRPKVEALLEREIGALRADDPTVPFRTPAEIRAQIGLDREEARERRVGVSRREIGFSANLGAFLGTSGAILTDPPVLLSMFFGAPWATSLLRASVIEAGAAGVGEALAQVGIQGGRRQFGEEPDLSEAALAVGIAAGGAGVLAPVLRGGAMGVRALLKQAERLPVKSTLTRAAERFLRRKLDLEDLNPFDDTPAARAEHAERMTEAQVALREGRAVNMPETPRAAVRDDIPTTTAPEAFGDEELGRLLEGAAEARGRQAAGEADLSPASSTPPPSQSTPSALGRRTAAEEFDIDTPEGRAEVDELEAQVRAMAEAEPNETLVIEDGETVRTITNRQLIEEIDRERGFAEAVNDCLRAA